MGQTIDVEAIRKEIEDGYASLAVLTEQFGEDDLPPRVATVAQAIRAQLEAAQALLT